MSVTRQLMLALAAWVAATQGVSALPATNVVVAITARWRYTTNNMDTTDWRANGYDDSAWSGPGNALLYIETAALPAPANTTLPPKAGGGPTPC